MSNFKNELLSQEYVYDFSVDGGAISDIELSGKAGAQVLPVGAIVQNVHAWVETLCTSGGAATVSWGNGTGNDVDGYSGTAKAIGALALNAAFEGGADSGALCPSYVSSGNFSVSIAAATLTAGKIVFRVSYYIPA